MTPGYTVDNPLIKDLLRKVAQMLAKHMPVGWGFTVFIFEYTEKGSLFYISSALRSDMIQATKEWLRHQGETSL